MEALMKIFEYSKANPRSAMFAIFFALVGLILIAKAIEGLLS